LVISLELETLDEEEDKGNTHGAGPSSTWTKEEEPRDFRGRKDSPQKEASGMTCALK
jgi:hypothetical protein